MKHHASLLLSLAAGLCALEAQTPKSHVLCRIDETKASHEDVALKIWHYAEVSYQEVKSSALLQEKLRQAGFAMQAGVAGIPTAFIAS